MINCEGGVSLAQQTLQSVSGGSNPTPSHHINWVVECSPKTIEDLIKKYHYLGDKPFRKGYSFALRHKGFIKGGLIWHGLSAPETTVGAFGLDRKNQDGFFELGRLVVLPELNGKGITSFFISHSIRLLRKKTNVRALITYADSERHNGIVYRASNFKYYGLTKKKKDFYINGKIKERGKTKTLSGEWKDRSRKHRYMLVFDKTLTIKWKQNYYKKEAKK